MEDNTKVENVHGEVSETQKMLEAKRDGLQAFLAEDPEVVLEPFLRRTENATYPDIRMILVNQEKDGENTDTEDAGEDEGEADGGGEDAGVDGSNES